ncbi:ATP phosphoribosyltransferase regulatory subunit [Streptomyces sp. NPDC048560]|uniref:ATP phosphoribosyltransferase regulatory subunit n=1 Tax=Streptomyces sp. NPDC048560 TaxID=3155488 RepID=UPI003442F44A
MDAWATPRGFADDVGPVAAGIFRAEAEFRSVVSSFGFLPVQVSPVGYAATFEQFGTAAAGRIFSFADLGGRELALTADSLVGVLRALAGTGALRHGRPVRAAACVPVARYRHKRRRGWTQAVAALCNEQDELGADLTLLRLWTTLLDGRAPGSGFRYCDFSMIDKLAEDEGLSLLQARNAMHQARKQQPVGDQSASSFLRRYQKLVGLCGDADAKQALAAIDCAEPLLRSRTSHVRQVLGTAGGLGAATAFSVDWPRATEYCAGLSFTVHDADGRMLGDGGGYHHVVRALREDVQTCWSTAVSIELLAELLPADSTEQVHLLKVHGSADLSFFLSAARELRACGTQVIEHWRPGRIGRELKRMPSDEMVWFAFVGEREQASGVLTLQNTAVLGRTRQVQVRTSPSDQPASRVVAPRRPERNEV